MITFIQLSVTLSVTTKTLQMICESARKGLNAFSGTQFAALSLVKSVFWIFSRDRHCRQEQSFTSHMIQSSKTAAGWGLRFSVPLRKDY